MVDNGHTGSQFCTMITEPADELRVGRLDEDLRAVLGALRRVLCRRHPLRLRRHQVAVRGALRKMAHFCCLLNGS